MWHCHEKRCRVVICQRRDRCRATRTRVCSHWFPLCIGQVLQSRPALRLCMTCLPAAATLSLIVVFHFLLRSVPCVFCPCPCSSAAHRSALAQDCYQRTVCLRDLEDFLSHVYPARDPCAFPDEARFDSPVLHPQHIDICQDVVVQSLRIDSRVRVLHPPVAVSVCRLCVGKTTRSSGVQQTLAPILSRTASILRISRSHLHCDTCTMSSSSRVCSTSAC